MDLKNFLPGKSDEEEKEYFWSLIIEPGWVAAGIWRVEAEAAEVVVASTPSAWELDEELINASDSTLSSAIQGFPEGLEEPSKTVFGVASSWVSEGEIRQEYLEKIKKLCSELSLTPIGFVVVPEAIAHLIKSEEGSPLNAIVIGIYKGEVEISVFRLGKLAGTTQVARSVSLAEDVVEGLTRFALSDLPSRVLIYNAREGELEEARQALLKVNWEDYDNLKFLHTPKIETVEAVKKVYAVALAGGSEIASVTSIKLGEEEKKEEVEFREEKEVSGEAPPEDLGFVLERDVAKESARELETYKQEIPKSDGDESLKNIETTTRVELTETPTSFKEKPMFGRLRGMLSNLSALGLGLLSLRKAFSSVGKKPLLFGIGFLSFLSIAGFAFWWFYPKATVTVYVSPKRLEETIDIEVDTKRDSPDLSSRILTAELQNIEVSGEKTRQTSGTKTVGEKATGEVTLYRVGPQLTLSAGTLLHGPDNLNFVLDENVTIASGSAGTPGVEKAKVTAEDIGAQYNLASGATFAIANYSTSDIEAKNEAAFSGGSSREISAVSDEDQRILRQELEDELLEKAKEELTRDISSDKLFIEESITATPSSSVFSSKVGDEASTLKLSLSLESKALLVEKSQLVEVATSALSDKIPEGFVLRGEQIEFDFERKEQKGQVHKFEVRVSANLLPKVDTSNVVRKIRGKYPEVAQEVLESQVPGFVRAEIKIRPTFPGRLKTLPHVSQNIEVEIAAER